MQLDHIFLDIDGVLADFVTKALDVHNRLNALETWPVGEWDIAKVLGMTSQAFWKGVHCGGAYFWSTLRAYPWALDLVRACKAIAPVTLASVPSQLPESAAGKLIWINQHFPSLSRNFVLAPEKHFLSAPGRLLIDDSDDNCEAWQKAGGEVILFPQPWNRNYALVRYIDRMAFVRERIQFVQEMMAWQEGDRVW